MGTTDFLSGNIDAALAPGAKVEATERISAKVRRAIDDLNANPQAYAMEHPLRPGVPFDRNQERTRLEDALAKLESAFARAAR